MNHQEGLTAYLSAFVAELATAGVTDVVISPGSRSTPLAMIIAEHPDLRVHVQIDERSAGFFALGVAKASKKPAALLCTSGTAAANYFPAIIEASISRVPLIVMTADRPHELRDVGAPQAIDQINLYGKNVKWFVEMAPPENTEDMIRYARTVCARAAATAIGYPAGPVHLNFPLREPLIPELHEHLFESAERTSGYVEILPGKLTMHEGIFKKIAEQMNSFKNGIIVCGPIEEEGFAEAVIDLADALKFPVLSDPLSQLRSRKQSSDLTIDAYDTFLRSEEARNALKPDLIIRFGAMPVSKALTTYIKENRNARQLVIDGGGGWRDPGITATEMIYCDETQFCQSVSMYVDRRTTSPQLEKWQTINALTKDKLSSIRDVTELSEGKLFFQLADMLPEGATLFVGNSMPIRDLDTFFHLNGKNIRVMANRGANGIDGTISTALGAATVSQPLYLVVGDLTFYHDLNGLLAAKMHNIDINILLINNNGGGIFSFLPQADHPKHFEVLFGTPVDLDFKHAVKMYNGSYEKAEDWNHFTVVMNQFKERSGLKVVEVTTARDSNLQEHRELWNSVSREMTSWLSGEPQ
ncbi:2-succinyl-5-enolpyruvyl-6-hydroxy-3-cyclohexene-1-carboxylic-acid synthase [Bacillus sp. T33-2]|uniref:2-succinyl-5-enolpyruvyl-6-hydroxy-3- cyclohexene-1-carboxylic-acid synthase n=1 Tax=Bacillus sp. T33-2 TaxID=2054168 RepID=UPI000C75CE57|nr:2-succinyl-5-enolpyruvyl-6-hydroxy-3-cyclohexene-1-carboxylic-acid synthase [Bacillus sp. T33-2]PLR98256.1 2-succinyl-5-enolpyruvyl-6-hydroxy-3-cyclohexene-1-carboxylic-acid synthase [Bacillus sp. T33-2]